MLTKTFGSVTLINGDCQTYMADLKDKAFELAVVDPPYGLGIDGQKLNNTNKNPKHNRKFYEFKGWDDSIPNDVYFSLLKSKTSNQVIWGGNYFTDYLKPSKAWLIWYKGQNDLTMSDCEMAWTSTNTVTRQITINRFQIKLDGAIHPTQKPVALYEWILKNYAKPNDKILDTHLGSGSSAIAALKMGFTFVGIEIDKEYFDGACERVEAQYEAMTLGYAKTKLNKLNPTLF